jgi:CheY-like chemotaxis protein
MASGGKTVLLVDGSATLRYYFGILLKRLKFTVMIAESAEEAFSVMEGTAPSLLLTDLVLPKMSVIDFLRTLQGSDRTKDIPVIVLADNADAAARASGITMGCVDVIAKQADPDHLYRVIQIALEPVPREHIRLSIPLKVVVGDGTEKGGAERTEYAMTISEGGLYLRTLFPRPQSFSTPLKIFVKNRAIRATAAVMYSHAMESGYFREPGMGMKFVEITREDRSFVRRFIKEELTSDIAIRP